MTAGPAFKVAQDQETVDRVRYLHSKGLSVGRIADALRLPVQGVQAIIKPPSPYGVAAADAKEVS